MTDMGLKRVSSPASMTIFPSRKEAQRTVCVLGAPRGGTSMIAGILRKLGVFMGDDIDAANSEDLEFQLHRGRRDVFTDPGFMTEKNAILDKSIDVIRRRNEKIRRMGLEGSHIQLLY